MDAAPIGLGINGKSWSQYRAENPAVPEVVSRTAEHIELLHQIVFVKQNVFSPNVRVEKVMIDIKSIAPASGPLPDYKETYEMTYDVILPLWTSEDEESGIFVNISSSNAEYEGTKAIKIDEVLRNLLASIQNANEKVDFTCLPLLHKILVNIKFSQGMEAEKKP